MSDQAGTSRKSIGTQAYGRLLDNTLFKYNTRTKTENISDEVKNERTNIKNPRTTIKSKTMQTPRFGLCKRPEYKLKVRGK